MRPSPLFRLYGRRKGRPLRARKEAIVKKLLPQLKIILPKTEINAPSRSLLDPVHLFSSVPKRVWLEIGFGGGEHLAAQAKNHPYIGLIGCEPFLNGIASLCDYVDKYAIGNIRIFPDDARILLDILPDASIDRCFVLFPDPWPKARHAERRFIGPENAPRLARVLQKGAELYLATDNAQLAEWIRICMKEAPEFECLYDSRQPPEKWVSTRYEQKGIKAGRRPVYMIWRRT